MLASQLIPEERKSEFRSSMESLMDCGSDAAMMGHASDLLQVLGSTEVPKLYLEQAMSDKILLLADVPSGLHAFGIVPNETLLIPTIQKAKLCSLSARSMMDPMIFIACQ